MTDLKLDARKQFSRALSGTRFDPRNSTAFSVVVISLALIVMLAAAAASFEAQMAEAQDSLLFGWSALILPVVIDAAQVVLSLLAVLSRSRGQSARILWSGVGFLTLASVFLNVHHVLSNSADVPLTFTIIKGAAITALFPCMILLVSHSTIDLLVVKPALPAAELRAQILQEFADESAKEKVLVDAAAALRQAEADEQLRIDGLARAEQRAVEAQERELADAAAWWKGWGEIKSSPESRISGTWQRDRLIEVILEQYRKNNRNVTAAAAFLGIPHHIARRVIDSHTLEASHN